MILWNRQAEPRIFQEKKNRYCCPAGAPRRIDHGAAERHGYPEEYGERGGFDLLVVCGFAFDASANEAANQFIQTPLSPPLSRGEEKGGDKIIAEGQKQYGKLPVLLARMNPNLAMGEGRGHIYIKEHTMTLRELSPDFDEWPDVWMGIEEDRVYGKTLRPYFEAFLNELIAEGLARRTIKRYIDHAWLLGGMIIKEVDIYADYKSDPLETLYEAVYAGGMMPDDLDSDDALTAFERMCGKFEKFLERTHPRLVSRKGRAAHAKKRRKSGHNEKTESRS